MKLLLERIHSDAQSTLGRLSIDGQFAAWVCEDEYRAEKIVNETRIPAGLYRLALKTLGSSHFDADYLKRFGAAFHRGMIEVRQVPGFTGVLIHIGNKESDTSGCLLVGAAWARDAKGHYSVTQSEVAYRRIYPGIRDALERGDEVTLEIRDLDRSAV